MADPNHVAASVDETSTMSTLAIPPADVVVGVTEIGRALTVEEIHAELRQGATTLLPKKELVSVDPKGSVFARFEGVQPGLWTAHAWRVDDGGVIQAMADPVTKLVKPRQTEFELFLVVPELTAYVTDTASPPNVIEPADVRLTGPVTLAARVWGKRTFKPIPPGEYTVTATHPSYKDGSAQATVTVTPSSVTVRLKCKLEIMMTVEGHETVVSDGEEHRRIVGQPMALSATVHTPAGHILSGFQWNVPGERVKEYKVSNAAGICIKLEPSDLTKQNPLFHWIVGGKHVVTAKVNVDGEDQEATATFNVLAPTGVKMTSETGGFTVGPVVAKRRASEPGPATWLNFGALKQPGIKWDFRALQSVGGAGYFAGFQLIKADQSAERANGTTLRQRTGGKFVLDEEVPYDRRTLNSGVGIATALWESEDSPGIGLDFDMTEVRLNADFRVFFMYLPVEEGSIWVTLGVLEWHCRAATTRNAPGDSAAAWSKPMDLDASANPKGVAASDLPTWTTNIKSVHWK